MDQLQEDKISHIVIDLGAYRDKKLDESFLRIFGNLVKMILKRIFGGEKIPVSVRGTKSEIKAFAGALEREKRYAKAFKTFGLDDVRTYENKSKLNQAVSKFERITGLKWPFE